MQLAKEDVQVVVQAIDDFTRIQKVVNRFPAFYIESLDVYICGEVIGRIEATYCGQPVFIPAED